MLAVFCWFSLLSSYGIPITNWLPGRTSSRLEDGLSRKSSSRKSLLISIALVVRSLEVRKRERKIKQVDTHVCPGKEVNDTAGSEKDAEA